MGLGRKAIGAALLGLGAGGKYIGDIKQKQIESELFPESTADIKDYNKLLTLKPEERSLFISSKAAGKAMYDPASDTVKQVFKPSTGNKSKSETSLDYKKRMGEVGRKLRNKEPVTNKEVNEYSVYSEENF